MWQWNQKRLDTVSHLVQSLHKRAVFTAVPLQGCQRGRWAWQSFQWSQSRTVQTPHPCGHVLAYGGMNLGSRKQSNQPGEHPWEKQQTRRWWGCSCGPSGWSHLLGYPTHLQNIEALVNPLVKRVKELNEAPLPIQQQKCAYLCVNTIMHEFLLLHLPLYKAASQPQRNSIIIDTFLFI